MKRCPNCQRTYPDDAPGFCVNDGTQLVTEEATPFDPQKTILASTPQQPPPQYSNLAPPSGHQQPPQQYQAQNAPPAIKPPTEWPPQAQNWGGYYQQPGQAPAYPQPYAPPVAAGGKGLSLSSFIFGLISLIAVAVIFLMSNHVIVPDRDLAAVCFWGTAATGLISIVLGILALISKRQRSKWMAILGIVLGLPGILFFIYVMINYGF